MTESNQFRLISGLVVIALFSSLSYANISSPYDQMIVFGDSLSDGGSIKKRFDRQGNKYPQPVLANLFGSTARVAMGIGSDHINDLRQIGEFLADLKEPKPPSGWKDAWQMMPLLKEVWHMSPQIVKKAPCQEILLEEDKVDLYQLPIQHCWPGDVAPLITWGLTVTQGPHKKRQNLGIYRLQLLGKNKLIMRWLAHQGDGLYKCYDKSDFAEK